MLSSGLDPSEGHLRHTRDPELGNGIGVFRKRNWYYFWNSSRGVTFKLPNTKAFSVLTRNTRLKLR